MSGTDHPISNPREERLNVWTHALGAVASVAAGAVLIVFSALRGDAWRIVGASIFVASAVTLYTASAVYHATRHPRWRQRMRVVDHASIYLLIAGTYTPFTLVGLRGGWGWSIFGVIWGLAVAGVIFKIFMVGRLPRLSSAIYVAMGWLVVIAAVPMLRDFSPATLGWLLAGGLAYTTGVAFYAAKRMPYAHAIWHLFVLAGTACHGIAVATNLLGAPL